MGHTPSWFERSVIKDADRLSDDLCYAQRVQDRIADADARTAPARFAIRALAKSLTETEAMALICSLQNAIKESGFGSTDAGEAARESLTDAHWALENAA